LVASKMVTGREGGFDDEQSPALIALWRLANDEPVLLALTTRCATGEPIRPARLFQGQLHIFARSVELT